MAVTITWRESTVAVTSLNHGNTAAGAASTAKTVFIEHDGDYQLSSCRLYLAAVESSYTGDFTAEADKAEVLGWGDGETVTSFGGFQINMDAVGSFPVAKWPVFGTKYGSDYSAFYTGRGDTANNSILLASNMNSTPVMPADGVIPANCTTWPSFKCRFQVPTDEGDLGARQVQTRLRYVYTS